MGDAEKRGRGRPSFTPTQENRSLVETLAGFGVPRPDIARQIKGKNGVGITEGTLLKYFRDELEGGVMKANAKVAKSLFENAVNGNNIAAQIFWLKTRGRWKETPQEIAFPDEEGKPQAIPTMADFYKTVALARMPGDESEG
jgi:hypothetical protein